MLSRRLFISLHQIAIGSRWYFGIEYIWQKEYTAAGTKERKILPIRGTRYTRPHFSTKQHPYQQHTETMSNYGTLPQINRINNNDNAVPSDEEHASLLPNNITNYERRNLILSLCHHIPPIPIQRSRYISPLRKLLRLPRNSPHSCTEIHLEFNARLLCRTSRNSRARSTS